MALMRLNMDMPVFSTNALQAKTLSNWREQISDVNHLRSQILHEFMKLTGENPIPIVCPEPRVYAHLADIFFDINAGYRLNLRLGKSHVFKICNQSADELATVTVRDSAQIDFDSQAPGAWLFMLICTWRAVMQGNHGPIPGINLHITIPGIVATCLRLGVHVTFEADT